MKTYLVIGGSSGIGEGVVKELAHDNVVIATYCKNYKKDETPVQYVHFDVMSEQDLSFHTTNFRWFSLLSRKHHTQTIYTIYCAGFYT
jgi:NADP-dependent 3-hydroxy acid dehydrogenase YdfG